VSVVVRTADVERFRTFIARRFGLHFDESKTAFLDETLRRRLEALRCGDGEAYFGRVEGDSAALAKEIRALASCLTVPETYFFRNIDQFHALARVCLPDRVRARAPLKTLRFLSAGCASGEEPYSLAISALGELPDGSWDFSVLGVDVNAVVLDRAARAQYSTWSLRETPAEIERAWFRREGREVVLDDRARRLVRFEEGNLFDGDARFWSPETYDVVFCRNVLMYFTPEAAQAVIDRIARSLAPGGYLFLGHAETLRGISTDFHLCHTHGTFYYRRHDRLGRAPSDSARPLGASAPPPAFEASSWIETIRRATERIDAITSSPRTPTPGATSRAPHAPPELSAVLDLFQRERYSEALEGLSTCPVAQARDADALLLRAVLLAYSGQLVEAEGACRRLLELDELNAGAHYALALCREGAGDRRGALDHDQVAIYLDRSFAMPRLHLGLVARKSGDMETARRELGQALTLLQREDPSRILLFGGGFGREALVALCKAQLATCGGQGG
jgi:chemotaxis protein methyltransferase CheR